MRGKLFADLKKFARMTSVISKPLIWSQMSRQIITAVLGFRYYNRKHVIVLIYF